tara:strand:- start:22385 stop:23494 length:1110 start_codon:yes stop_codon:yes gene_type:complete
MPGPTVENIFPADHAVGVVIGSQIWVIFDKEIDITTIPGNFVIEGPDTDRVTGPDMVLWDRPDTLVTENILDSPNFKGIVKGVYSAELLDLAGNSVSVVDTTGASGGETDYKHKIIFTPSFILSPTTSYTVYLTGDESTSDGFNSGIATRTVFDPVKGANLGSGDIVPSGGYTGIDDIFRFRITTSGSFGVGEFEWWRDSDALSIRTGTVSQQEINLVAGDGLAISWSGLEVTPFISGDTFSVQVRAPLYMSDSYVWDFATGSGNIQELPSTTSTSPIGTVGITADTGLQVVSITPDIRATNVDTNTRVIKIEFNKNVDPTTVTDESVHIQALPVNGDNSIASSGEIMKILTVKDNYIYATLQSGKDAS